MIEHLTSNAAFSAFNRTGTYTPPEEGAEGVEVEVILDLAIEAYDEHGKLIVDFDTIDFVSGSGLERDGVLSDVVGYDGLAWKLLSRMSDDGMIVVWSVERIDAE